MTPNVIAEWMAALEAERLDISYRKRKVEVEEPAPKPRQNRANARAVAETYKAKPSAPTPEQIKARADRDALIYNAGRYAAGARDTQAIEAFNKLHRGDK